MKFKRRAKFLNGRKQSKEVKIAPIIYHINSSSIDSKPDPKFPKSDMNNLPNLYRQKIKQQREDDIKQEEIRVQLENAPDNQNYDKPFEMEYNL